jgi:MoaA/NifB/PqqE/SkfB family radical SAM enzyme
MRLIRKPVLCNYYLTYRCNAKCGFCDIWEKPSPYADENSVRSNLTDLKRLGVKVIDFTGGEPLLHRQLPAFLRMAKEMGFITTVTSNALLYPKNAEKLKGLIDMLHFSLDSIDEEKHNASRGVKCYDKLMESLELAHSLDERPDIIFTVHPGNIAEIGEVYEKLTRPRKLMLILNPIFAYNDVGSELGADDLKALYKWSRSPGVYLNRSFLKLREDGGNHIADPVCRAASSTIVIAPDNKLVLPCYHLGLESLPIENNLYELRQHAAVKEAVKMEGRYAACEGCTINCYMQPSFAVELNRYFLPALEGTIKYSREKGMLWNFVRGRKKKLADLTPGPTSTQK